MPWRSADNHGGHHLLSVHSPCIFTRSLISKTYCPNRWFMDSGSLRFLITWDAKLVATERIGSRTFGTFKSGHRPSQYLELQILASALEKQGHTVHTERKADGKLWSTERQACEQENCHASEQTNRRARREWHNHEIWKAPWHYGYSGETSEGELKWWWRDTPHIYFEFPCFLYLGTRPVSNSIQRMCTTETGASVLIIPPFKSQ